MVFKNKAKNLIDIKSLDKKLSLLRIPLSMVMTPINLEEEKLRFFSSEKYNPKFKYRIVKNSNSDILKELLKVEKVYDVDPRISDFYIELIQDKKLAHDLMVSVGNNELFTDLSKQKFRSVSSVLFRNACRVARGSYKNYSVVDTSKIKKGEYVCYPLVKEVFECLLSELGLKDWSVNRSKNIKKNGVKTGIKSKEIFIDPDIAKRPLELKKTVVHELTHILRAHNGALSGVLALEKPNINSYLDIEEGFAMWHEEKMGYLKDVDLKERAVMVYAIYIGECMSFRELYNVLFAFYPKNKSFYLTYLAKRGMGDTSLSGICTKSGSYFRGFRKVRRKLQKDLSLYNKLFAGKISLSQVPWVEEGLVKSAEVLPDFKLYEKVFKKVRIN